MTALLISLLLLMVGAGLQGGLLGVEAAAAGFPLAGAWWSPRLDEDADADVPR